MSELPKVAVAEQMAARIIALEVPQSVREKCIDLAVDVIGLCATARNEDYVKATLAGCDKCGNWGFQAFSSLDACRNTVPQQ